MASGMGGFDDAAVRRRQGRRWGCTAAAGWEAGRSQVPIEQPVGGPGPEAVGVQHIGRGCLDDRSFDLSRDLAALSKLASRSPVLFQVKSG